MMSDQKLLKPKGISGQEVDKLLSISAADESYVHMDKSVNSPVNM